MSGWAPKPLIHVLSDSGGVHAAYPEGARSLCGQVEIRDDTKLSARELTCSQCRLISSRIPEVLKPTDS